MNIRIGNQSVNNVFGQPFAKSVADLAHGVTLLLGMDEIGFGKHGAARRDLRRVDLVAECDGAERFDAFQVEPFRLLIQKAAGSGGTG